MGIGDILKGIVGRSDRTEVIVGTIVEGPTVIKTGDDRPAYLTFRIDSRPDLEFRQEVRPLAPERRRGDRVKVHCQVADRVATVEWVETA